MKANELRVGNWVYCIEDHVNIEILPSDIQLAGQFKPIPLTEEWLLKFGLEKEGIRYSIDDEGVFIWSGLGDFESYGFFVKIKYVHQLQNLYFALTGEDLMLNS